MSSRDPRNWRGSRKPARPESSTSSETPSWKKERRGGAKASSGRSRKTKFRLLVPIVLLLILVAVGIAIFRPQGKTHTHFVVLNPLAYSQHFDAAQSPVFPMVVGQRFPSGQSSQETPQVLSIDGNPSSGIELGPRDALVVSLQTQILAGADGKQLICLSKNSTPDLPEGSGKSAQFQPLSEIKNQLIEFRKHSQAPILLIVDCLSSVQHRRLGQLPVDTFEVLKSWVQDDQLPRMAVVVSSGEAGISVTGPIGSGGQTAFGHTIANGFSTLADQNQDGELHLKEFCQFVQSTVLNWSLSHRDTAGQRVQIYPAVEEIEAQDDFTLMKDIPTLKPTLVYREDKSTAAKLNALWEQRDQLNELMTWRWVPTEWQSSTEFLLRAQEAYLNGNSESSNRLMIKAGKALSDAAQQVEAVIPKPSDLNQSFGLPRSWFVELPLPKSVLELWEQTSEDAPSEFETAGAVLQENRRSYPFEKLNLPGSEEIGFRDQAEEISSKLMSVSRWVSQTVRKAEVDLLESEDRLFTRATPEDNNSLGTHVELWQAIGLFAEAHLEAELEYQRVLAESNSLSQWVGEIPLGQPAQYFKSWDSLLRQNLPQSQPNASSAAAMVVEAQRIADKCGPGINGRSARLPSSVFQLLLSTRVLRSSLYPQEPEGGFSAKQLNAITETLNRSQRKCRKLRLLIASELLAIADNVSQTVATRPEQVLNYQRHRSLLRVTGLDAAARSRLIISLWRLEEQLAEPADEVPSIPTDVNQRRITQGTLWYLQHLNLLSTKQRLDHPAMEIGNVVASVKGSNLTVDQAGRYGKSIREFYVGIRSTTDKAAYQTGKSAANDLKQADQFVRTLSAFDTQLLVKAPTQTLHTTWQTDFAFLQTDRRLQGLWVLPGEGKPWNVNGWYGRVSSEWLSHATSLVKSEYSSRQPPDFLQSDISKRQEILKTTATPSVTIRVNNRLVSIGDQNASQGSVGYSISTESITEAIGTAAVGFQTTEPSPLAQNVFFDHNSQAAVLGPDITKGVTTVSRRGTIPASECQSIDYFASVFFRGRRWTSQSPFTIDPCPTPEFVVTRFARPPSAAITLAGTDKRPIMFVLDMSGSMEELVNGKTRAQLAIETLSSVIRNLSENDVVSLKVFGHRMKYESDLNPDSGEVVFRKVPNPKWRRAFNKQLDPNADIETILMPIRLTPKNLVTVEKVLEELNQSGPWGITPLAGAIKDVLSGRVDDGNLANRPGVVVAISDGLATDIGRNQKAEPDGSLNRIRSLQQSLKSNKTSKVVIVALDFKPNTPQRTALESVFMGQCEIPVVDAKNQPELLTKIQESLDPRRYTVSRLTNSESTEQNFGQPIENLKAPDRYTLAFADLTLTDGAAISLKQGDDLQVAVDWSTREFLFVRGKAPQMRRQAIGQPAAKDTPTILRAVAPAVYRPYPDESKAAVQSVEASLMLDHDRRNLPVQQPEEIQFQIRKLDGTAPKQITEQFTSEWGAPGWKLRIEDWPMKEYVRVSAFWKMTRTAPELVMSCPVADQPAIQIGDQSLPQALVTTTVLPGGILRIRLDPVSGVPYSDDNAVSDIRVETGVPDLRNNNQAFRPDEVSTTTRRTETGSLIIDFKGQFTRESLDQIRVAFTSAQSRRADALSLPEPLMIDTITTEN